MSNRKTFNQCGVMLYQSMSGDEDSDISAFMYDISTIKI